MLRPLLFAVLCLATVAPASAQFVPDETFGSGGSFRFTRTDLAEPSAVLPLASGKTLVGGVGYTDEGFNVFGYIARLRANGTLDPAFGQGGVLRLDSLRLPTGETGVSPNVERLIQLPDGRIAVAGNARRADDRSAVLILDAAGRPDPRFGTNGVAVISGASFVLSLVATQDGLVVLVGDPLAGTSVQKLRYDGTPDPAFGTAGVVTVPPRLSLVAMTARPDGGVVLAGSAIAQQPTYDGERDIVVAAYTPRGVPDAAFAGDGVLEENLFSEDDQAFTIARFDDGRLVVAGLSQGDDRQSLGVVVYAVLPDGRPDFSFGFEGWTWTNVRELDAGVGFGYQSAPFALPEGRIGVVVGPNNTYGLDGGYAALALKPDGAPDPRYGTGGLSRVFRDGPTYSLVATAVRGGTVTTVGRQIEPVDENVVTRLRIPVPVASEAGETREQTLTVSPNPAAGATRVSLVLDVPTFARVTVLDALGRTVTVLQNGPLAAGETTFTLDAARLPAGVYAVVVEAGAQRQTTRVTVVRST